MMKRLVTILLVAILAFRPAVANANKAKEIIVTTTYGVIAGTIVGVASLAFSSNPGGKLRNIAVGASLGLYAGILLGTYLAYAVELQPERETEEPSVEEEEDEDEEEDEPVVEVDKKKKAETPSILRYAFQNPAALPMSQTMNYNTGSGLLNPASQETAIMFPVLHLQF